MSENKAVKPVDPVQQEFEEWWARTHSHVDRPIEGSSALMRNLCGMIKVIAQQAWVEADAKRLSKALKERDKS